MIFTKTLTLILDEFMNFVLRLDSVIHHGVIKDEKSAENGSYQAFVIPKTRQH